MADREIRTEQQVKDKIKAFNKQRAGLLFAFIIFIGILIFSPAAEAEALPACLPDRVLLRHFFTMRRGFRDLIPGLVIIAHRDNRHPGGLAWLGPNTL